MGYQLVSYQIEITNGRPLIGSTQINYKASDTYSSPIVVSSHTTSHTYTNLASGSTFHVRVRAMTTAPLGDSPSTIGGSLYSEPAVGLTTMTGTSQGTTPSAPIHVHVRRWDDSSRNSKITLKVSWNDVTSSYLLVSTYIIYYRLRTEKHWRYWIKQSR
jgi:hypothetical protein